MDQPLCWLSGLINKMDVERLQVDWFTTKSTSSLLHPKKRQRKQNSWNVSTSFLWFLPAALIDLRITAFPLLVFVVCDLSHSSWYQHICASRLILFFLVLRGNVVHWFLFDCVSNIWFLKYLYFTASFSSLYGLLFAKDWSPQILSANTMVPSVYCPLFKFESIYWNLSSQSRLTPRKTSCLRWSNSIVDKVHSFLTSLGISTSFELNFLNIKENSFLFSLALKWYLSIFITLF